MRILITNDDGVYSEGIQSLWRELENELPADDEVFVVAPERERSASGHAITLHKPLHVNRIPFTDTEVPVWAVNGTPADCTKIAVMALLDEKPDLIISGINRGANLGTDVFYSGTVSAAIEGAILGITSIAISLDALDHPDYELAAGVALKLVRRHRAEPLAPGTLWNVNVPAVDRSKVNGVAATKLGVRRYIDRFDKRQDPRGRTYYWLTGEPAPDYSAGTDMAAVRENMISVTPVSLDLTAHQQLDTLEEWLAGLATTG